MYIFRHTYYLELLGGAIIYAFQAKVKLLNEYDSSRIVDILSYKIIGETPTINNLAVNSPSSAIFTRL